VSSMRSPCGSGEIWEGTHSAAISFLSAKTTAPMRGIDSPPRFRDRQSPPLPVPRGLQSAARTAERAELILCQPTVGTRPRSASVCSRDRLATAPWPSHHLASPLGCGYTMTPWGTFGADVGIGHIFFIRFRRLRRW
jgi:hypothetical protein